MIALVLSLITYLDQRNSEEDQDLKEASRISWNFYQKDDKSPLYLHIDNRSLSTARNVTLTRDRGDWLDFFSLELAPACTRSSYELKGEADSALKQDATNVYLTYQDGRNNWWINDLESGVSEIEKEASNWEIAQEPEVPFRLSEERTDLAACG